MVGWESLGDAIASDSDAFGGQYLNRLTQLMIGADIGATDATLKPIIGTDWTFKSGHLYLNDANEDHKIQILPDNQTQNTVVKVPVQSYTPDYMVLRTQAETLQNKIIDAGQNTISNLANANIAAAAGIAKSKLAALAIVDADVSAHTTTKITTTNKALLNTQIAYKDETVWLTDAMVAANAAIAKTKLASLNIVDADVNAAAAIAKTKLAALAIVDADVNAHTSTKITITDKTHLNNQIIYQDASSTLADGINIAVGSGTGTRIGTATTQKIGFYNKAPVAQATAIASPTSDTVGTKAAIDGIRTALINLGLTA